MLLLLEMTIEFKHDKTGSYLSFHAIGNALTHAILVLFKEECICLLFLLIVVIRLLIFLTCLLPMDNHIFIAYCCRANSGVVVMKKDLEQKTMS